MRQQSRIENCMDVQLRQARAELFIWGQHYRGGGAFLSYPGRSSEQAAIDGHARAFNGGEIPRDAQKTEQKVLSLPRWAQLILIQHYCLNTYRDGQEKPVAKSTYYDKLHRAEKKYAGINKKC